MSKVRRLIESDFPIRAVSLAARHEKSVRSGHPSSLHLWWARRPLAACRAVALGLLLPDPNDPSCPPSFLKDAQGVLNGLRDRVGGRRLTTADADEVRRELLSFIAGYAAWEATSVPEFADAASSLVKAAGKVIRGDDELPLVIDPFSGGGAISLEALRVGADAYASDLNPVATLISRMNVEALPRYGAQLADEFERWGAWVLEQAASQLSAFYPRGRDGSETVAYLWARTIVCEGPGCGAEIPLLKTMWLAKRGGKNVGLVLKPSGRKLEVELVEGIRARDVQPPTVARGSATCPCCGYTTAVQSVRVQLAKRSGGSSTARLLAVVTKHDEATGRAFRPPNSEDLAVVAAAAAALQDRERISGRTWVPDEEIGTNELRRISVPIYGMTHWRHLFTARQLLTLSTITQLCREAPITGEVEFASAVRTLLAFSIDKLADLGNGLCRWEPIAQCPRQLFGRQAIGMVWDFAEGNPLGTASGSWRVIVERSAQAIRDLRPKWRVGTVAQASALHHPLPDDAADVLFTDPPYYDAVPYAHLSDFFYVWLKRALGEQRDIDLAAPHTPKTEEAVVDRPHERATSKKGIAEYEQLLTAALADARRVVRPDGIAAVVFASKSTASWEAVLSALIDAGWTITGSWPIDTENASRMNAMGTASLASSVHIICRPREHADGSLATDTVGEWRAVIEGLQPRIARWMERLAEEGVVGADAIFACLGPALELFSQHARVQRASGERVLLREYLEHVWAAISKQALSMIFEDADAEGFEPDARISAMWLWTIAAGTRSDEPGEEAPVGDGDDDDDEGGARVASAGGLALEFDAARKIAQSLGVHLDDLDHVVEVTGQRARLLPVKERASYLFSAAGSPDEDKGKKTSKKQRELFSDEGTAGPAEWGELAVVTAGKTALDRVHQAMILFAANRSDALRRFVVDDGAGRELRFWKLAQALSALYPPQSEEKRWVDGLLARKKGLGF